MERPCRENSGRKVDKKRGRKKFLGGVRPGLRQSENNSLEIPDKSHGPKKARGWKERGPSGSPGT